MKNGIALKKWETVIDMEQATGTPRISKIKKGKTHVNKAERKRES